MENQLTAVLPTTSNTLNQLVSSLISTVLPTAVSRKSFIVNEIPRELHITSNENMLATVLSSLLSTVVSHTENSCIRVSAKVYGGIILVYMKDSGSLNNYAVSGHLQHLQPLAKKIGGCISVGNQRKEIPSIAFSFPYMAKAA